MRASRIVALCFGASTVASIALIVVYALGGKAPLEGALLGFALGGLGAGIVIWATELMDASEESENREPLASPAEVRRAESLLDDDQVSRRSVLLRMLAGAGTALVGALAVPALSLGPRPGQNLFRTRWREGLRVVDHDGNPIRPSDVITESVTTVYPEGFVGSADAQTLLLKLDPSLLELSAQRRRWVPQGCIGYSKICTHAGCPVGLYRAEDHELLCPCHQSTFDVLRGAVPTFGPAARALPQLPLGLDDAGYLVALGDFPAPVGPGFWNMEADR